MSNLSQDLELLRQLNENRKRAKELRKQGLFALKQIELKDDPADRSEYKYEDKNKQHDPLDFDRWVGAGDDVEVALLIKIQSHRELDEDEATDAASLQASDKLNDVLKKLDLKRLLQQGGDAVSSSTYPVLLAARGMQALVSRAETVFEPATMYCYYRIIRELYGVAQPNWTVGAARAGVGGTTSSFVTNECIRAIFAFERALKRTYIFFEQTGIFFEYFSSLQAILTKWDIKEGPLYNWVNKSIEARWLDCQIATSPRNREMALFYGGNNGKNKLLLPDEPSAGQTYIKATDEYFKTLPANLGRALEQLFKNAAEVYDWIYHGRRGEDPEVIRPILDLETIHPKGKAYVFNPKRVEETRAREEEISRFNRTETAHLYAMRTIENAVFNAHKLQQIIIENTTAIPGEEPTYNTEKVLTEMAREFYKIRRRVHHVLEPSKQYLKMVLNRELAAPPTTFDAGELVFAATSYGAIHNWRLDDRLTRACELLVSRLPDTGRLPTKRPFHADRRGYRTIPIGCEMTRSLATLLQKTGYVFDAKFVDRMLDIFEENVIELDESRADRKLIGWNFEGAADPDKPAVWVTAISVLALDRMIRMLNTRINEIVLAHFDVTKPERPHTQLTLRHLIYSDYVNFADDREEVTAIHLQKARAHLMRASLPKRYAKSDESFSAIYYGPPHTGKTTLAEALALSAGVPILRLSPGDLILQGQELIEGRAHDVFEALSMLSQCVIIFDEFEPVLKHRSNELLSSRDRLGRIGDVLKNISDKDDPKFRFVLGGMLPKLIKLHDSAEKHSFVYCLATNRLGEIDSAAKRKGRFDSKRPIYKPDALSRAGTLLYYLGEDELRRLSETNTERNKTKDQLQPVGRRDAGELRRFFEAVARTVGEPADHVSKLFRTIKTGEEKRILTGTLKYVLNGKDQPDGLKEVETNLERLREELRSDGGQDENEGELRKRESIMKYEEGVVNEQRSLGQELEAGIIIQSLNRCLNYKGESNGREPESAGSLGIDGTEGLR
jgi:hypothetical protein